MNTNKTRISAGKRIQQLAAMGEVLFHAGDAANVWGIKNKNTLYKTLSRFVSQGLLYRIYGGLYSLKNPDDLDPHLIGIKAIHRPAYISCETVLYNEGIINQSPREITLVSNISKRFSVLGRRFRSRKMKDDLLMRDDGIKIKNGVRYATSSRAKSDMLYFNPKKYFDA